MLFAAVIALVVGTAAGAWVGRLWALRTMTTRLVTDRDAGLATLEALANRWGARLELFEVPGSDA